MPSAIPPDLRPKKKVVPRVKSTPVAAPKTQPKAKTGMAGLYGGVGPSAYVDKLYAPQTQLLAGQQEARSKQLSSLVGQFLASLNNVGSQLAPYTAAASQQSSDARNAASSLAAANPNAVTQNDLAAINAPQSQQQQVAGQNQTAFGGNAALLQYAGGAIPAGTFRADAAGRAAYLAALPNIGAAIGVQGVNQLSNLASRENLQLAGLKSDALQKARADLSTYMAQKQSNQISQAAVLGNLLGYIPAGVLGNAKPITSLSGQKFKFDKGQAKAAADVKAKAASAPNASLSRVYGYVVDSNGNALLQNGQQQPIKGAAASKPKGNSALSKSFGYVVDNAGAPILRNGKKVYLPKSATKKQNPLGLSSKDYQKYNALALGAARNYHRVWKDADGKEQDPLTWQEYLTHGLAAGVPAALLVKQGKKVYSQAEIRQGLIPGTG